MNTKPRLGDLLVQHDLLKQDTLKEALRIQVGGNRRLGNILVRMKAISEDQLVEILAEQLQIDITDIGHVISGDVKKSIPRYLCKKYDVIPLKLGENNTIKVAMSDPSDDQTIKDLEQYTGRVVDPHLARQSDIATNISKHVPWTINDLLAPQAGNYFMKAAVAVCLVMILAVGGFSYQYVKRSTYGTVSQNSESTIYKNHDLMLALDSTGKINLLGRGAYAKGYYSIAFNDTTVLKAFISSRTKDFSEKQRKWLNWALIQVDETRVTQAVATN